ncbi:type II secretion system major pseudopilin GspG [Planctomycetota bacterium]
MNKCSVKVVAAKGFTLLELLLVITIIGVLMSVVAPKFFGRSKEAKIAATRQMISGSFRLALALFEQDVGRYPSNDEGLQVLIQNPRLNSWKGPYLESAVIPPDPWGNQYSYSYPSEITASEFLYDIVSAGPDGIMGNEDDVSNHYEYLQ